MSVMRAVVRHEYGGTDRLHVSELPDPVPGAGEVLVRVRAAAVDRGAWHLMTGLPLLVRPMFGLRHPRRPILGREVAGVVAAVGAAVTGVSVGDEVVGTADGAFAELAVVPVGRLGRKPADLDFAAAATLPVSGLTALQAVRDHGRVSPGDRVLVIGASGGVGTFAVQIATARGADVTAVCSGAKADLVRSLGATRVIDHTREEIDADATRYDVVIDIAGNRPLALLRRVLTPGGTLVIVGGEHGGRWFGGVQRQLAASALSAVTGQRLTAFLARENADDLAALADLADRGLLRAAVAATYDLGDAARALDDLEHGRLRGKAVLIP